MRRWTPGCEHVVRFLGVAGVLVPAFFGRVTPAAARVPEILAFGDSLTAGFGLPADAAFPSRLEARLRAEGTPVHVTNAGNSGDTTTDGLARLDWSLADKPDIVIL